MDNKIKKETDFDVGCQFCNQCQEHRFFYRLKQTTGVWFCQLCNHEVTTVKDVKVKRGYYHEEIV